MVKPAVDYTLYLVTGRELVPPGKDYYESLEESLKGGVTVVQVREKKVDTREFLEVARKTKEICDRYNIPVLINDRVDIAIAIKAHGVHVGQDDMPIEVARSILGNDAIIGVSAGTVDEAKAAVAAGADYIGIGAVYPTGSKSNAKLLGVRGVGPILSVLEGTNVKSVVIGGIKSVNLLRVLHGAVSPAGKPVDGIAVISEIISSQDPRASASHLIAVLRSYYNAGPSSKSSSLIPNIFKSETSTISPVYLVPTSPDPAHASADTIKQNAAHLLTLVKRYTPMIHQITNNVVINQSANATLALGASPIMATAEAEQEDLAKIPGGLLVNFGTVTDKAGMLAAGKWANFNRKPVVFDPVGVGATGFRRSTAKELLDSWQAAVIKGNAGEIASLLGTSEVHSRGVDSVGSGFANPAEAVLTLARRERCVVVMTGPTDYISNGQTVVKLDNGCELLGNITGSGCMVGTAVATFCGAASVDALRNNAEDSKKGALVEGDMFVAAIAGVLAVTVAADIAVTNEHVKGPASFLTQLLDELYALTPEKIVEFGKVALAQEVRSIKVQTTQAFLALNAKLDRLEKAIEVNVIPVVPTAEALDRQTRQCTAELEDFRVQLAEVIGATQGLMDAIEEADTGVSTKVFEMRESVLGLSCSQDEIAPSPNVLAPLAFSVTELPLLSPAQYSVRKPLPRADPIDNAWREQHLPPSRRSSALFAMDPLSRSDVPVEVPVGSYATKIKVGKERRCGTSKKIARTLG